MRTGKVRTREHILEDYSAVHFERNVLDCGYSVERTRHDYGIAMTLYTYDAGGGLENDAILIQSKATDSLRILSGGNKIALSVGWADLEKWQNASLLVILILYDAQKHTAY